MDYIVSLVLALGKVRKNVIVGVVGRWTGGAEAGVAFLEEFARVQQDGHGTFVDQFDTHPFLETAGFATQAYSPTPVHK